MSCHYAMRTVSTVVRKILVSGVGLLKGSFTVSFRSTIDLVLPLIVDGNGRIAHLNSSLAEQENEFGTVVWLTSLEASELVCFP